MVGGLTPSRTAFVGAGQACASSLTDCAADCPSSFTCWAESLADGGVLIAGYALVTDTSDAYPAAGTDGMDRVQERRR